VKEGLRVKATGIVRRIDDLGRVVIPKEIRRTLRIREGDPLEIFVDRDGEVILKKYSPVADVEYFAQEYADSLYESTGYTALIADDHEIVAVAGGPKKTYLGKELSQDLIRLARDSEGAAVVNQKTQIVEGVYGESAAVSMIKADGVSAGFIVVFSKDDSKIGSLESRLVQTAAGFLGKQLTS
jgi:AbrB family transcriptional regulator (stage V sporulation protein T)